MQHQPSRLRATHGFAVLLLILGINSVHSLLAQYTQATASSLQDTLITLSPSTENGEAISINITALPASGTLYDLSDNYVNFGYSPVRGTAISSVPYSLRSGATQTGPSYSFRVVYAAPAGFTPVRFSYQVLNSTSTSTAGIVEVTSSDRVAAQSSFLLDNNNWNIIAASTTAATWTATSVGSLSRFIYGGTQGLVINSTNSGRWYFKAPPATYARDNSALYNGVLSFTMAAFEGDFSSTGGYLRSLPLDFVTLICSTCNAGSGITLSQRAVAYTGDVQSFSFILNELPSSGWLKDPKDIRVTTWSSPTACEFVSVLRGLSEVRIYGDWTTADEVVGMDGFTLKLSATPAVPVACY